MKYTVLEMTQQILSSMDSDEVNSISDTTEAGQVALLIRSTYFDIITRAQPPSNFSLFNLQASGDNTKPVLMSVPNTIASVNWVKYDVQVTEDAGRVRYADMDYVMPEEFLERMYLQNSTETGVGTFSHSINGSTILFIYRTDRSPSCYTVFDNETMIFDAYDSAMDTTLTASKSQASGRLIIPFTLADSFVPDLDDDLFPLLLNECKALAWAELKQTQHGRAEASAKRGWTSLRNTQDRGKQTKPFDELPNFGRRR